MIRILVADDHAIVRAGVKQIVSTEPAFEVVAEAENGQEVFERLKDTPCDLVLLDISMPDMSGLDVLKQIKNEWAQLPVLVLTMHPEAQYAIRVLKGGAAGYLTKDTLASELIGAIQKASQGGKYVSEALAEQLIFDLNQTDSLPHEALSDREFQVLRMMGEGLTSTEIADQLALSVKTISTYRSRILQKMGMQSNAELMRYIIEHDLLK